MNKQNEKKGSVVTINFEAQQQSARTLFSKWYSTSYPDSLGKAIIDGEEYCIRTYGNFIWKPVQWNGLNIPFIDNNKNEEKEAVLIPKVIDKNDLMKDIITKKDRKLFQKYKVIFTENELKLLKNRLRKKPVKSNDG